MRSWRASFETAVQEVMKGRIFPPDGDNWIFGQIPLQIEQRRGSNQAVLSYQAAQLFPPTRQDPTPPGQLPRQVFIEIIPFRCRQLAQDVLARLLFLRLVILQPDDFSLLCGQGVLKGADTVGHLSYCRVVALARVLELSVLDCFFPILFQQRMKLKPLSFNVLNCSTALSQRALKILTLLPEVD